MDSFSTPAPQRPQRLRCRFESTGSRLTISYRDIQPVGCFLLLWLIGWTVGCIFLAGMVIKEPGVMNLLFAIPFWAAWIFVFCMVANSFFRTERFELGPEGVQFVRRVIVTVVRRTIPLDEVQGFGSYLTATDSESNAPQWGLEVSTSGQSLRFGQRLPEDERVWLAYQLDEHLSRLKPHIERKAPRVDVASEADMEPESDDSGAGERLTQAPAPLAPPSDSRWRRSDDFHELEFVSRGRFGCTAVAVLLFINAFWNGIVSVFVSQLILPDGGVKGFEWWGLFLFLIPFEAIGLLMFVGLLVALVEPFRRTKWSFTYGGVERRTTWLGIGPRRTYPVDWLDRIELRGGRGRFGRRKSQQQGGEEQSSCRLVFIDRQNAESFSIEGLSEGEARWMADVILRQCDRWFR